MGRSMLRPYRGCAWLAGAGQDVDCELVEALVGEALFHDRVFVEVVGQAAPPNSSLSTQPIFGAPFAFELTSFRIDAISLSAFQRCGFIFEDEIVAHAAAGEIFHAFVVFGAIGMRVEMARAVVADVFEKFHQKECRFDVHGTESQVLIETSRHLIVQIDVKKFAGFPGLRDVVQEIQPRHRFVREFGIHADHLGMIERRNEAEIVSGRRHIDVAARLVGLGFHRKLEAIFLVDVVLAQEIDGVAQMLYSIGAWAARVGLDSLAAAPKNENFRAKFGAEIHRAHRFLHGVGAHFGIARGERAVAKNGMREERNSSHRHDEPVLFAGALEGRDDRVALVRRCVDRNEIVVVQVDAPRADFGEHRDDVVGRNHRTHEIAKGIAPAIPYRPQTKCEFMFWFRFKRIPRHGTHLSAHSANARSLDSTQ